MAAHTGQWDRFSRSQLAAAIQEACLGEIDGYIARAYLIDKTPHIEIAGELAEKYGVQLDRSTVTRHWNRCKNRILHFIPSG